VKTAGIQILAELHNCDPVLLNDVNLLQELICSSITANGFNLVRVTGHQFQPAGVTIVAIISESHVCVHTFPESRHVSLDMFHCGSDEKSLIRFLDELQRCLKAEKVASMLVERGKERLSLLQRD
jgi:S-adenosylmethionine decarboxylase proenzyme